MKPVQLRVLRAGWAVLAASLLLAGGARGQLPAPVGPGTAPGQIPTAPISSPPDRGPTEVTPTTTPQPAPPTPPADNSGTPPSPPVPIVMRHVQHTAPSVVDPKDPKSWVWEYRLPGFTDKDYQAAVETMITGFEQRTGRKLTPGKYRHAGIKVMTSVAGLSTPPALVRAVIAVLVTRGFKPEEMFILDQNESRLRTAGFLPPVGSDADETFAGVPVIVMERGRNYDAKWNYDSPLPAPDTLIQSAVRQQYGWKVKTTDRLSLLPVPLLLNVDFWINLPVGVDQPALGLTGALASASIYASSNTERFTQSPETGAVAVAEIAAVPELDRGWVFSILSLEHYQFIGGPRFNSMYTESEPTLLLSANPVVLDYLLFKRMNWARTNAGFPLIDKPSFLDYAQQLDLGEYDPARNFLVRLPK